MYREQWIWTGVVLLGPFWETGVDWHCQTPSTPGSPRFYQSVAEDLACFSPESLRHRTREERAAEERQKRTPSAPLLLPGLPPPLLSDPRT